MTSLFLGRIQSNLSVTLHTKESPVLQHILIILFRTCIIIKLNNGTALLHRAVPWVRHLSGGGGSQGLVQVSDEIFDVLNTHRQTHHVGSGAGGNLLLLRELAVSGGGRVDDQTAGIPEIGHVAEVLEVVHQLDARVIASLHGKSEETTCASGAHVLDTGVVRGTLQASVGDEVHSGVFLQPFGDGLGVSTVLLHAQRQGFDTHQGVVSSLGIHGHSEITEADCNAMEGKSEGTKVAELKAVVGRLRLRETGELTRGGTPIKLTRVHNYTTCDSAVAG